MTFNEAVSSALRNYATFSGRARRSEFWWFYLFTFLVSIASSVADAALGAVVNNGFEVVGLVTSLLLFVPSLAVTARRLHDTGRSGWWMLLPLVPFVVFVALVAVALGVALGRDDAAAGVAGMAGVLLLVGLTALAAGITLLVFLCLDSAPGPNKYGPSPKHPVPPTPPGYPTYPGWPTGGYPTYPYGTPPPPGEPGPTYGQPGQPPPSGWGQP